MEEIINFHHYVMVYLTFILFGVAYILGETLRAYSKTNRFIAHKYLDKILSKIEEYRY